MGSNSSGYDVVVKLHEAPGRVSSSMKLQQAAAAAAPGPPGCCRSSPSSSYLQAQNQSRSLGVASSEIVQLHHHRHHHHLHGSLSLQADDDPESLMPSEFNKQLVSKTTSFHIPESGTFPLTFAPVDDQLQEPPPRESYYASSDSSSVKDLRDVMEEQQWNLHSDPMGLTMQIGARSAAASSSSVLPIVLKARTLSATLLR
ncbi:unnamed protein product [Sphagnum troendelagicum]